MAERLGGTETEYLVNGRTPVRDAQLSENDLDNLIRLGLADMPVVDSFLQNGGRFYRDRVSAEYCTPEDELPKIIADEIAGEEIVQDAAKALEGLGNFSQVAVSKRGIGHSGNPMVTFGYHENYLTSRRGITICEADLGLLGMHLATRPLYTGAGLIRVPHALNSPIEFFIAQKVLSAERDFHNGTIANKPLVNLRDKPYGDPKKYTRVHVISGDPLMSPWAARMQLGTTSLVLGLVERGVRLEDLRTPKDQMHLLARQVATDLTLAETVELANGRTIRPLDIQAELCETVAKRIPDSELSEHDKWVLGEWEYVLDGLDTDPDRLNEVEWVAKKQALDHDPTNRRRASILNLQWDLLDPERGIAQRLRRGVWKQWMPDAALIASRRTTPPTTTRAHVRGAAIRLLAGTPRRHKVTWDSVTVCHSDDRDKKFMLDPYQTEHPELLAAVHVF